MAKIPDYLIIPDFVTLDADRAIIPEDEINGYFLTDDSCFQYAKKIYTEADGTEHWSFIQHELTYNGAEVRGISDSCVKYYSLDEINDVARTYSYDNLDDLKEDAGKNWQQILLEQIFESCPGHSDFCVFSDSYKAKEEGEYELADYTIIMKAIRFDGALDRTSRNKVEQLEKSK